MKETPQPNPPLPLPRILLSVKDFSRRNPTFSLASLRDLIFKSSERHTAKGKLPGNGLLECGAVLRCGRKVLIDETRFYQWLDQQNAINPTSEAA